MSEAHSHPLSKAELFGLWAPVLLWVGFIFVASSEYFSFAQTGLWLSALLGFVSDVPDEQFGTVHLIVRKTAHLVEYGLLGFLAYRAFQCTWREWGAHHWWMASLALALACASLDELRQSTIVSRTGSARDVLIDTAGASLGLLLFRWRGAAGREIGEADPAALDSQVDA